MARNGAGFGCRLGDLGWSPSCDEFAGRAQPPPVRRSSGDPPAAPGDAIGPLARAADVSPLGTGPGRGVRLRPMARRLSSFAPRRPGHGPRFRRRGDRLRRLLPRRLPARTTLTLALLATLAAAARAGGADGPGGTGPIESLVTDLQQRLAELPDLWRAVALGLATFVSEDLATIAAGLLVARGDLNFWTGLTGCTLGIWVGDGGVWALGRFLGRPALRLPILRRAVTEESIARAERWFAQRGIRVVVVSRFLPGSRLPAFFAAGLLGARAGWFLGWALLAALAWTPLLMGGAVVFAPRVEQLLLRFGELHGAWKLLPPVVSLVVLVLVLRTIETVSSWRGRRLWRARWVRRLHWEFWPPWVFYVPCVAWYLALALRHRSLTLPTVANPGIPGGGFIGESKGEILQRLVADRPEAQAFVASTLQLPAAGQDGAGSRLPALRAWMGARAVSYPIVLKPDVGQRGSGVRRIDSEADARAYLEAVPLALVAQSWAPGPHELGVFWARAPGERTGRIVSVTEKFFPEVTGDGHHDLADLILLHPRAVLQHKVFFRRHAEFLDWVPGPGARFPLVTSGNHCQGTLFKDGRRLGSDALRARLDALADGFPGLHAGRFDLRAEDLEAVTRGQAFRIVELNGATAEATHIYDPDFGPLKGPLIAYATLFRQWSLMFALGAANRAAGHRPIGVRALAAEWRAYRRAQRHHPVAT